MAETDTSTALHTALRNYLEYSGRGAAHEICLNTDVSAPELSNWLTGRRALPDHKLVSVFNWLIANGKATITFNH
jgi:hypothetical protein